MSAATARQPIPKLHVDCTCRECTPSPHPLTRIDAIAEALPYPGKAQAVIDAAPVDMQEGDWLEVALAAIDQAGFPLRDQAAIERILRASFNRRTAREVVS